MSTTWIDVADTSIKIGLGAAIASISAYLLAGRNHSQTLVRDLTTKRISILESACTDAEEFFSFCTYLYNIVGIYADSNADDGRDQTEEETKLIIHAHEKIIEAFDARNRARAKISLLGATDAFEHISKYNETLGNYRDVIGRNKKMFSSKRHDKMIEDFNHHKQAFYAAAADFMKKIGSGRDA